MSYEYAGTLFRSKGAANRASVEDLLSDEVLTSVNIKIDSEELADEFLSIGFLLPHGDTDRETLIDVIDEVKESYYEK